MGHKNFCRDEGESNLSSGDGNFYTKFRNEIAAGGATDEKQSQNNKATTATTAIIVVALLAWLGIKNPWSLVFVAGLIVSVFLHELGHYLTARRSGMKVTQFYMGMGPRIFSFRRGEVEFGLRALPVGAFVRIVGMNNLDDCDPKDEPRTYRQQSYPKRMLVITAGSLMHLLIAVVLFVGIYATAGRFGDTGNLLIVAPPAIDSPAEKIGLREGDQILAINDTAVNSRYELIVAIVANKPGESVDVKFLRDGQQIVEQAVLATNPANPEVAFLGVSSDSYAYVRQNIFNAFGYGLVDVVKTAKDSVSGLFVVLNPANIVSNVVADEPDMMTRPTTVVGASQVGGEIGRSEGFKGVLMLLASVNIFVGVFNMLPLLPFDGGHAAIATYERLRSRRGKVYRADVGKMIPVATTVVVLLVMLMFAGLYLDITSPLG
ncbi:MAG: PDZ domain-containing protein [Actinobacteria bacterium]|nr:PDZ domain-containing protein [Acidimicrobiia bacterium]NDC91324.1 PDZ domain-containing protein [Acidimicrobiia bacterium]NDD72747.1 PDZ domain-containing protein [Actinomycetota bacterium]NDF88291.1 PDZ domain-containing protein [Actinomycetota bacterium]